MPIYDPTPRFGVVKLGGVFSTGVVYFRRFCDSDTFQLRLRIIIVWQRGLMTNNLAYNPEYSRTSKLVVVRS